MPTSEHLHISIEHHASDETKISALTLDYPTMTNAQANKFQLDIVAAIASIVERYAKAKAQANGETWPEV